MELRFIIEWIIIWFSIAAPVGPIWVLCIRRSLNKGALSGFLTGLGAATADASYWAIAAFGLTLVSSFLIDYDIWIQSAGILFLLYLGIKIFFEKPKMGPIVKNKNKGLLSDYFSTLGLTITNPMTIVSFTAVFAGVGISNTSGNYLSAALLVLGVFIGSNLWWIILSNGMGILRKKTNDNTLKWVNRISGIIIVVFALILVVSLVR